MSTSDSPKTNILIVEDSPTQAARLSFILDSHHYAVAHARNGAEALEMLRNSLPNMVISDVVMPVMDGYEMCRKIKSDARFTSLPVMLLTTLADPGDIFRGLESGADHYVIKPYEEDVLLSRIRSIIADKDQKNSAKSQMGIEITYGGHKYFITADRIQILDLLLATFENVVKKNRELEAINQQLKESLEANKILRGLIPICAYCKKIRDDQGYWQMVESYVSKHTDASFSHGICPSCAATHFSEVYAELKVKHPENPAQKPADSVE